jgi:uncharacterized protein YfiM (DUF2279 family)
LRKIVIILFLFLSCKLAGQTDSVTSSVPRNDSLIASKSNDTIQKNPIIDYELEIRKGNPFRFPSEKKPGRLATTISIQSSLYLATMLGLNDLWYAKYEKSKFHTFDDGQEWMQMDKIAHATSAATISSICYNTYRWSGIKHRKALFLGCAVGLSYMTTIEILDGYSSGWGFSVPDMVANIAGCSFFFTQQYFWQRQYIKMKMSYHPTKLATLRPELLGDNGIQRVLKDYNGMTFWMDIGASVFVKKTTKFPRWLCLSIGYGADGMLGGFYNPTTNEDGTPLPDYKRIRQFYLSFDVDFSVIKTKSKFVKVILIALNSIKVPFPTLEYNTNGKFKFHYLYF